ncbi:MAG: hypothetical protein JXB48_18525 [Candidatus Latescibacteria bacterium]|nr:hypothetical protein [Candidatus Latescibacterota bacterium]
MLGLEYIDKAEKHLMFVSSQLETVKKAGKSISDAVLNKNKIFVVDRYGVIENELIGRSSGLALFQSYDDDEETMGQNDILILSAFYPAEQDDLDIINNARAQGAKIITISPEGPISKAADIALINGNEDLNDVMYVPGIDQSFCPLSGILNAVLAWTVAAETTAVFLSQGKIPTSYRGDYLPDGVDKNSEARKRYISLGY